MDDLAALADGYLRHFDYVFGDGRRDLGTEELNAAFESDPYRDIDDRVMQIEFRGSSDEFWTLLVELVARCNTTRQLGFVAAGPVENFLIKFGDSYLEQLTALASVNSRWQYAIWATYPNRMPAAVAQLVERLHVRYPDEREVLGLTGLPAQPP